MTFRPLPAGVPGLVFARVPSLARGYVGERERWAAKQHGPWWNTGDIGVLHGDGSLRLLDREVDHSPLLSCLHAEDVLEERLEEAVECVVLARPGADPLPVVVTADGTLDRARWKRAVQGLPPLAEPVARTWDAIPARAPERSAGRPSSKNSPAGPRPAARAAGPDPIGVARAPGNHHRAPGARPRAGAARRLRLRQPQPAQRRPAPLPQRVHGPRHPRPPRRGRVGPGHHCLEIGAGGGSVAHWLADRVAPGARSPPPTSNPTASPPAPVSPCSRTTRSPTRCPRPPTTSSSPGSCSSTSPAARRARQAGPLAETRRAAPDRRVRHLVRALAARPSDEDGKLYQRFLDTKAALLRAAGGDPAWGRHAAAAMRDAGLTDIDPRPFIQPRTPGSASLGLQLHHTRHLEQRLLGPVSPAPSCGGCGT